MFDANLFVLIISRSLSIVHAQVMSRYFTHVDVMIRLVESGRECYNG